MKDGCTPPQKGYKLVKWLFGKEIEIPEDWKTKTFEEVFEFLSTATNSRNDLEDKGDVNYIHYGDMHTKWKIFLDCKNEEIPFIDKIKVKNISLLKEGDLVIADASEDHEGSGTSILLKNVDGKKLVSGLHTIAIRDVKGNTSVDFRAYLTSMNFVTKQIIARVTGVSVYGLSKKNLKQILILLPLIHEQQKIASILSRVDALIECTQEVVNKAELLKKGLMQELLTRGIGHKKFKRVRGLFGKYDEIPEEWEIKPTAKILQITMGQSPPSESYNKEEKGLPFYQGVTDFGATYPNPMIWCTDPKKTTNDNSILFSVRAPVGEINLTRKKCCLGRGVAALNPIECDLLYCYYLVNHSKKRFLVYSQGTTYDAINQDEIANTKLPYTKNIKEQQKIASILSGVDAINNLFLLTKIRIRLAIFLTLLRLSTLRVQPYKKRPTQ